MSSISTGEPSLAASDKLPEQKLFWGFAGMCILALLTAMTLDEWIIALLPAALLFVIQLVVDFKKIFWLLCAMLPLSMDFYFGSFGMDLPTDPLMLALTGVYIMYALLSPKRIDGSIFRDPMTILLGLHLTWIAFTTLHSTDLFVSVKWLAAKIWYIVPFYLLANLLIKSPKDIRRIVWCIALPLTLAICVSIFKHSLGGFAFSVQHDSMKPFFVNHVQYGALLTAFLPFVFFAALQYERFSSKWIILFGIIAVMLAGVYFSYTRAAWGAVFISIGAYFIVRFKLVVPTLAAGTLLVCFILFSLVADNTYLKYNPKYEKTISHSNVNDLMSATMQGKDVSTMERVYRWVAARHLIPEHIATGVGPGNFVNQYRKYTVTSFKTYVSRNELNSGIHNYYLLMLAEQGLIGLLLYLALIFYALVRGQLAYHRTRDWRRKGFIMAAVLSLIVVDTFHLLNDIIEMDKNGALFFMCMAIIVSMDEGKNKKK